MGRGVSSGGGQSSLGYLFGDAPPSAVVQPPKPLVVKEPQQPPAAPPPLKQSRVESASAPDFGAGKLGRNNNNYHRAEGQNTGNFITDRPSTKVHSAPGGGSSLGYLFGDSESKK